MKTTLGSIFSKKSRESGKGSISQTQALSAALAACMGTGNIVGGAGCQFVGHILQLRLYALAVDLGRMMSYRHESVAGIAAVKLPHRLQCTAVDIGKYHRIHPCGYCPLDSRAVVRSKLLQIKMGMRINHNIICYINSPLFVTADKRPREIDKKLTGISR